MHPDAQILITYGCPIAMVVMLVGWLAPAGILVLTGAALIAAVLATAVLFDYVLSAPEAQSQP